MHNVKAAAVLRHVLREKLQQSFCIYYVRKLQQFYGIFYGKEGAEFFMTRWFATERARAALRHAVVSPSVTGRTKERVAQSKRARNGLLVTID